MCELYSDPDLRGKKNCKNVYDVYETRNLD